MTDWIIPLLLSFIALWALLRKTDLYDGLTHGAAGGLTVIGRIAPPLVALLSAVTMLRTSGALDAITSLLRPLMVRLGIPPETAPILLIRPLSGSGAIAVGGELMATYGPDSPIGRTAAVMLGCSETTFYTVAVYFGAAGIKKTRYAIPAALLADLTAFLAASWCVKIFFV